MNAATMMSRHPVLCRIRPTEHAAPPNFRGRGWACRSRRSACWRLLDGAPKQSERHTIGYQSGDATAPIATALGSVQWKACADRSNDPQAECAMVKPLIMAAVAR